MWYILKRDKAFIVNAQLDIAIFLLMNQLILWCVFWSAQ